MLLVGFLMRRPMRLRHASNHYEPAAGAIMMYLRHQLAKHNADGFLGSPANRGRHA